MNGSVHADRVWQPLRGPFQRWPHGADLVIAAASFALTLMLWSSGGEDDGVRIETLTDVATFACVFVGNFALLWRRSHPVTVHGVVLAASILAYLGSMTSGVFALVFSLYALGRYTADDRQSLLGMLAALAWVATDLMVLGTPSVGSVIAAGLVMLLWYIGRRVRFRGEYLRVLEERAAALEREKTAGAERAVAEERTRIARELHDVVAHQLSLMTVQAGAAQTVARTDPDAAAEAMTAVQRAGRQALAEMRHLLGVLRPAADGDKLGPQPGAADLPRLVERVNEAGPTVTLQMPKDLPGLPARLDLAIYRIIQEALTNVIKHAGAGASATARVDQREAQIEISVVNSGGGVPAQNADLPAHQRQGHGLVGMRERVEMLGGTVAAGPAEDGGFEVRATLPLAGDEP
ncbi:sensor histidine kinase [Marinihelvus fidelis]|uniref:histidine kinase n=1 Tax=Marinihelvus fidelis TaxID=2613842 RepID=A0A5N0T674_9GAMM|nr:sensor histidine kinase [Marinihelvus fidelis]KAA9129647.1 sensor histidine kinase [Marinihelvus fidelis]